MVFSLLAGFVGVAFFVVEELGFTGFLRLPPGVDSHRRARARLQTVLFRRIHRTACSLPTRDTALCFAGPVLESASVNRGWPLD